MQSYQSCCQSKKKEKVLVAKKSARFYDEKLKEEINADRNGTRKDAFERPDRHDKDDDDDQILSVCLHSQTKQQKQSETDPMRGWFHKGT